MRAEERQRLCVVQRYALQGRLIRGVMHELNNAVQAVTSYSELILLSSSSEKRLSFAREIQNEALGMAQTSKQIMLLPGRWERRAPETLVESAMRWMRYRMRRDHIKVDVSYADDLPAVGCRPVEIEQILLNVLFNARDALTKEDAGGVERRIQVTVGAEREGVSFVVEDRGCGVDEALGETIFDAYVSTLPPGEGAGLGLFVSRELAEGHGGTLSMEPAEQGARFALWLPT